MLTAIFIAAALQVLPVTCDALPVSLKADRDTPRIIRDPIAHYGTDEIMFDVLRKGDKVGTSRIGFSQQAGGVLVDVKTVISVNFLVFEAYRFEYHSSALWCGGRLTAMGIEVNDNGEKKNFSLAPTAKGLVARSPEGETMLPPDIIPTNHWNPDVLDEVRVFNTLTGNINKISLQRVGPDSVYTGDTQIPATHYRYTGDLQTEVWYDEASRWVKLRFATKGGDIIEYRLATPALTEGDGS